MEYKNDPIQWVVERVSLKYPKATVDHKDGYTLVENGGNMLHLLQQDDEVVVSYMYEDIVLSKEQAMSFTGAVLDNDLENIIYWALIAYEKPLSLISKLTIMDEPDEEFIDVCRRQIAFRYGDEGHYFYSNMCLCIIEGKLYHNCVVRCKNGLVCDNSNFIADMKEVGNEAEVANRIYTYLKDSNLFK